MREHVFRPSYDSHYIARPPRILHDCANLEIHVRARIFPYVPNIPAGQDVEMVPDYGNEPVPVVPWPAGAFAHWRERFRTIIMHEWNEKLWLLHDCAEHVRDTRFASSWTRVRHIACVLRLEFVDDPADAHLNCAIYRLQTDDEFFRSSMARGGRADARLLDGSLDHLDLEPRDTGQIAVVHEFGHYLGLSHVAAGTPTPYGIPGTTQVTDLMGGGPRFDRWHAWPWMNRARAHGLSQFDGIPPITWTPSLRPPSGAL